MICGEELGSFCLQGHCLWGEEGGRGEKGKGEGREGEEGRGGKREASFSCTFSSLDISPLLPTRMTWHAR